jgi:hypothetical protein
MGGNYPDKHRVKIFEGLLRHYYHWQVLAHQDGLYSITVEGEEFSFFDLLDGIETLPLRQRQALWLIVIEGMKEREAADLMGYTGSSTPAQYQKNEAVKKLVQYHDSPAFKERTRKKRTKLNGRVAQKHGEIDIAAVFPGLRGQDGESRSG